MRKVIGIAFATTLLLIPAAAYAAQERVQDLFIYGVGGAIIGGPVGAVAGGAIGYTAGPRIDRELGFGRHHHVRHVRHTRTPHKRYATQ
jgi:membrane protein DedA with SNARE-associated domain